LAKFFLDLWKKKRFWQNLFTIEELTRVDQCDDFAQLAIIFGHSFSIDKYYETQ